VALDKNWFSEIEHHASSAFSLKIREKLHDERSPFQHIEVYATEGFGNLLVIDGCIMLTERDNFLYHEMLAHPALFTHPEPKKVLIIGGGDCGTLREVLKHPNIESVTQVDIDEAVTRTAERFFPQLCEANSDLRAKLHFADGIAWVKNAVEGSYDVIIVDSTDPVGPAQGLFTRSFFQDCRRALGEQGLLVQQSESPLFHLEGILIPMRQAMSDAGFTHVNNLYFPQCAYPSGWWTVTMAGKANSPVHFRGMDASNKRFATKYYNTDIHRASLAVPEFVRQSLTSSG
jgi:spermidine synthase